MHIFLPNARALRGVCPPGRYSSRIVPFHVIFSQKTSPSRRALIPFDWIALLLTLFFPPSPPPPTPGCLVNWLAEGLVGCWQAGAHGWQNEGLPRWLTRDTHWLTEWQLASYSMREINELFLWLCELRKSTNPASAGTSAEAICGRVVRLDAQFAAFITLLEDGMTRKCDLTLSSWLVCTSFCFFKSWTQKKSNQRAFHGAKPSYIDRLQTNVRLWDALTHSGSKDSAISKKISRFQSARLISAMKNSIKREKLENFFLLVF